MSADFAFASITDGTIDSTYRYAWSENVGWIDFGTTEGDVHVTDSALTGYAWAENIGWISLNCSNDSSCGTVDYKVSNTSEGTLSGNAWTENNGWIDFNPTGGGVTIDSNGDFAGYAWGENIGWIVFNCATTSSCGAVDYKVKTDWRPQSARPSTTTTTPSPGGLIPPPTPPLSTVENPEGGFKVVINPLKLRSGKLINSKYTRKREVSLTLFVGKDTKKMAISDNSKLKGGTGRIAFQSPYTYDLCQGQTTCPEGSYTIYVRFYTKYNGPSETFSTSIILKEKGLREIPETEIPTIKFEKPIKEMTAEELQDKINEILRVIDQLNSLITQYQEVSEIPADHKFIKDLKYGQSSIDVKHLQIFLNSASDTQLAESGPGSPNQETDYFGSLTKAAVIKFQEKHAQDILAPWELEQGTGLVGKTTKAKINQLLERE